MTIVLLQLGCSPGTVPQPAERSRVVALTWAREHNWAEYVDHHRDATIFHSLAWRNSVKEAFGHQGEYLILLRGRRVAGVLPMFLVRGPIIGRMLVSVPYGVGGGILADDEEATRELFEIAKRIARQQRCSMIDLRSRHGCISGLEVLDRYVGFERELPVDPGAVLEWLPRKARAMVRNAREKYGLECDFSPSHLPTIWDLYCRNMRRLASINYPLSFFEALQAAFGERCWTCLVRRAGHPVAGLLTLLFRDRVLPYFFGCDEEARHCGAANFIYACVMERAVSEGYRIFDFGRSRRDNPGSCDFKRFHGFEPRPLGYQRYYPVSTKSLDLTPTNPALALIRKAWPRLPLAITRPAGALLSNYIPG